jgi:hypothetical protein
MAVPIPIAGGQQLVSDPRLIVMDTVPLLLMGNAPDDLESKQTYGLSYFV